MRINGVELQLIEAGLTSVRNNCSKRAATKRRNQDIFRTRYGITNPPVKYPTAKAGGLRQLMQ